MVDRKIREIADQMYAEGYRQGTPQWDTVLTYRKVQLCMDKRGVASCRACKIFMHCELAKQNLRNLAEVQRQRKAAKESEVVKEVYDEPEDPYIL